MSDKTPIKYEETNYGFNYGAAEITRAASGDPGWVTLCLKTPKHQQPMQIYVTKTGKVRVFGGDGKEWLPND